VGPERNRLLCSGHAYNALVRPECEDIGLAGGSAGGDGESCGGPKRCSHSDLLHSGPPVEGRVSLVLNEPPLTDRIALNCVRPSVGVIVESSQARENVGEADCPAAVPASLRADKVPPNSPQPLDCIDVLGRIRLHGWPCCHGFLQAYWPLPPAIVRYRSKLTTR